MFLPLLVVRLHTNVTVVLSVYMCTPNLFKCVKYSFRIFTLHVQFSLSIHMSPPILLVYVFQTKPHFSNLTHVLHFFFCRVYFATLYFPLFFSTRKSANNLPFGTFLPFVFLSNEKIPYTFQLYLFFSFL